MWKQRLLVALIFLAGSCSYREEHPLQFTVEQQQFSADLAFCRRFSADFTELPPDVLLDAISAHQRVLAERVLRPFFVPYSAINGSRPPLQLPAENVSTSLPAQPSGGSPSETSGDMPAFYLKYARIFDQCMHRRNWPKFSYRDDGTP